MTSTSETSSKNDKEILSEADPASLDELFARDPLELTNDDIDAITTELRDNRALWVIADDDAKNKKKSTPRGEKKAVPEGGITLDDLDLGI